MDSKLIEKAHSELKGELGTIYKKRKATQFFQKIMWAITALFFVFMILSLVINYFPNLDSSFVSFFEQFQATTANPYGNLYPLIGFIVLLYVTTYFFTRRFSYFKQKESETIKRMVKSLFPKVDFAQNALPPTNEIIQSKQFTVMAKLEERRLRRKLTLSI
jgi:preprotein translocase subunit SecG